MAGYVVATALSFPVLFAASLTAMPSTHAEQLLELARMPVPLSPWLVPLLPLAVLVAATAAVVHEERAHRSRTRL